MGGEYQDGWRISRWVVTSSWVENIMLGGDNQTGWSLSSWVEIIKLGGEYQAGWRISRWVENIKVGGEYQGGWRHQARWR